MFLKETVTISFILSYKPTINRQMIMLPLHGQDTAAIEVFHWAGVITNFCIK